MNKTPLRNSETAKLLSEYIVNNLDHCPVSSNADSLLCTGWNCDKHYCCICIMSHADELGEEKENQ